MPKSELEKDKYIIIDWLRRLGVESQTGYVVIDLEAEDQPVIYANQAFYNMTGYSMHEVIGRNGRFLHGEKTDIQVSRKIRECFVNELAGTFEIINYRKDGTPFWNEISIQPLNLGEGTHKFVLLLQRDITGRKRTEALIQLQQEAYRGIEKGYMLSALLEKFCSIVESFFRDGTKSTILLIDDEKRFRTGIGRSMPKSFHEQVEGILATPHTGTCGAAINRKEIVIVEDMRTHELWKDHLHLVQDYNFVSSWAVPFFNNEGQVIGTFGIYFPALTSPDLKDIEFMKRIAPIVSLTIKYSQQQEEMLKLAYTDRTSGLKNRNYFMIDLGQRLEENKEGLVAFLSVDEYAEIVDQYGHRAGDSLMKEIGKRFLMANSSMETSVARFSDSTLAIVELMPLDGIPDYLDELAQCAMEPVLIEDMELFLSLKIGVSIITPKQQDADEVIRHADSALSKAKLQAGESICYFENEHDEHMMRNLRIANELAAALRREEVGVHLQPKVDLKTGEILSFEALARWNSPELGNIAPDIFIPAAEKNGKIRILEQSVLKQVMAWQKKRHDQRLELRQVAVNISADHFFHHSFIPYLVDTAEKFGIDHKWLQLEITERIGFVDIVTAQKIFKQLNKYGFSSSVDDFGTGYSSLSYLQKLPVNEIKIDRSFISNMHEPGTLAIVRTIIQLAENLNMLVVAEGIETEKQKRILLSLGCRVGQGYFFYRPMPLDEANIL